MSYENAPATHMLASHCTACGRPLLDADSVTAGLGPHCRNGLKSIPAEVRERANKIIHRCAREDVKVDELRAAVVELSLLGCTAIADKIAANRCTRVVVKVIEGEHVDVTAPYSPAFLQARGEGRWVKAEKVTRYPLHAAGSAVTAIRRAFGNALVRLDVDAGETYLNASDEALDAALAEVAAAHPAPAVEEVTLAGRPGALPNGRWGVELPAGAEGRAGALVAVTTRDGKRWVARLTGCRTSNRWSDNVWPTERL